MSNLSSNLGEYTLEDVPVLKRRLKALKGSLTRRINGIKSLISSLNATPSSTGLSTLKDYKIKMESTYSQIEDVIQTLINIEGQPEATVTELEAEISQEDTRFQEQLLAIIEYVGKQEASIPQTPKTPEWSTPNGGAQASNNNTTLSDLKPFILTEDHTPHEFENWKEKWEAYYYDSCLSERPIQRQHVHFKNFLDENLALRIQENIFPSTPIMGPNGCIALLEEQFHDNYPIVLRRLNFQKLDQQPGQTFIDWSANLKQIARGADLHIMTSEDAFILRYLAGCKDPELRKLFAREKNPSQARFEQIGRDYTLGKMTNAALQDDVTSNKTNVSFKKKNYQNQRNFNENRPATKITPRVSLHDLKGRCQHCGKSNHKTINCKEYHKLKCSNCKGKGHIASVCLGYKRSKVNKIEQDDKAETKVNTSSVRVNSVKDIAKNLPTPRLHAKVQCHGNQYKCNALPDSGTTRSLVSRKFARKAKLKILAKGRENISAANGSTMDCAGSTRFKIKHEDKTIEVDALVSSDVSDEMLISWHDLQRLGVIHSSFPAVIRSTTQ